MIFCDLPKHPSLNFFCCSIISICMSSVNFLHDSSISNYYMPSFPILFSIQKSVWHKRNDIEFCKYCIFFIVDDIGISCTLMCPCHIKESKHLSLLRWSCQVNRYCSFLDVYHHSNLQFVSWNLDLDLSKQGDSCLLISVLFSNLIALLHLQ